MKNCKLCDNSVEKGNILCIYHKKALDNLKLGYKIWKKRFNCIEWEKYLKTLLEISTTGKLIKQVIIEEMKVNKINGNKTKN